MKLIIRNGDFGYNKRAILKNVSLQIKQGEIVGILGPNGVGKTTIFRTIMGVIKQLKGEILIDEKPLSQISTKEFAHTIGYVPQGHESSFPFSVLDVAVMGRVSHLGLFTNPSAADYCMVKDTLNMLGIGNLEDSFYNQISGGERQMVLFARSLVQNPSFILMDEPTANMDFGNQVQVLKTIKKLVNQNVGIVMTTHNPDHAFLCCDRVILITKDRFILEGEVDEIVTEDNLYRAYGVRVKITECIENGKIIKSCIPIME